MKTNLLDYTKEECEAWCMPYFDFTDEEREYFRSWKNPTNKPEYEFWRVSKADYENAIEWYYADPGKASDPEMSIRALLFLISPEMKGKIIYLDIVGNRFEDKGFYISHDDPYCPDKMKGKALGMMTGELTKGFYGRILQDMQYRKIARNKHLAKGQE